jgi:hypothetical protein
VYIRLPEVLPFARLTKHSSAGLINRKRVHNVQSLKRLNLKLVVIIKQFASSGNHDGNSQENCDGVLFDAASFDQFKNGISPLRQEPVYVPTSVTDVTHGCWIGPIEVEECRHSRVELRIVLPKPIMLADLAVQAQACDLNLLRLLLAEHSHFLILIHPTAMLTGGNEA